ncbi:MAG: hypothetical protein ACK4L8_03465 [Nitrincola lacisaponensis]|uniref:hypothetical protein n=1 Tax=Nitrincola lacisaponensis TaxID=267850 RepID=UPI00391AACE3
MEGKFIFNIGKWDYDTFFSPLRRKEDVIRLLLKAMKLIDVSRDINIESDLKIILNISKMNRLIFVSDIKIFSISFPFIVKEKDNIIKFSTLTGEIIDNSMISSALSIIDDSGVMSDVCISGFADKVLDESFYKNEFWPFFRALLLYEDGYLRFDHDNLRENGKFHPLNHIDFCYTSSATYKLGLDNKIDSDFLLDILDISTDCHYIRR